MTLQPVLPSLEISLRTLGGHPLRTFLSTLGIVMGVGSLVAVLAVADGVEEFSRAQLAASTDVQAVSVRPRTTRVVDGVTFPNPGYPVFTAADGRELAQRVPEAERVTVTASGPALIRRAAGDSVRAAIVTGRSTASDQPLAAGRSLTAEERDGDAHVAVISHRLAAALGGPAAVLDTDLLVQDSLFRVIGVEAERAGDQSNRLEVPLAAIRQATDRSSATVGVPLLLIQARSVEEVPAMRQAVEAWLDARVPNREQMVVVENNQVRLEQVTQAMNVFKLLMGAIVSISLLVGGIGIMNVLLASVAERTREIGIRRAAGARKGDVFRQFLTESVLITGLGSGIGAAVGFGGAVVVAAIMRASTEAPIAAVLSWPTLLVAVTAAIGVGLLFGVYPALHASRLSPIDAIRHE